jgi:hypothetical protein
MANEQRLEKSSTVKWIPINMMRVSSVAQREFSQHKVDALVANWDPDKLGVPTVNERDGLYYIVDGQHRIRALEDMGLSEKHVQCNTYENLSEQEEASLFLGLNDNLAVGVMDKYKVGVVAEVPDAVAIDRIVRKLGLKIGLDQTGGTIKAIGTLRRVYSRSGGAVLQRTLALLSETYGDHGFGATVIDGISLMADRYGENMDDEYFKTRLGGHRGGVNGLLSNAEVIHRQTSAAKAHCVAAAAVQIYNGGRGGPKKLTNWWKQDE